MQQHLIAALVGLALLATLLVFLVHRLIRNMADDPDELEDRPSFIPADHLAEIGRTANAWAALELYIDRVTWEVAGVTDSVGACMTAQMLSIQPKLRALIALTELLEFDKVLIADLKRFQGKDVAPLQERRNRTVHDHRMLHEASGEIHRLQITAQGTLVFGMQPEPIETIRKTRLKIEATIFRFFKLRDRVLAEKAAFLASPERLKLQLMQIKTLPDNPKDDPKPGQ